MTNTRWIWNPAPGWPTPREGWVPPEGWTPDPSWPKAPEGWVFWTPDGSPGDVIDEPIAESQDQAASNEPLPGWTDTEVVPPHSGLPGIEGYPGFVTEARARRSRWLGKTAVGVAAGLIGLGVGLAGGGDADAAKDKAEKDAEAKIARIQGQSDELVDDAKQQAVADEQAKIDEAVSDAVADAVAKEKARRAALIKKAVAKAVRETKADLKTDTAPKPLASSTDPRFDTCGAANAAGYGNYRRGADPEYDWYDDRDHDGVVCE